jgi:hypothetical protein
MSSAKIPKTHVNQNFPARMLRSLPLALAAVAVLLCATPGTAYAQIFVANLEGDTITEYNLDGTPVGTGTLVSGDGLNSPLDIAVSGSDIFVTTTNNTILEYTTAGAPVGTGTLVSVNDAGAIAISGSDIFVTTANNTIQEYTTAGAPVGTGTLVSGDGLQTPSAIAISGSDIFVANDGGNNPITEYTTAGAPVGTGTLVSGLANGLDQPLTGIAVSGSDVFVMNEGNRAAILEFTTAGAPVGTGTLVSGNIVTGATAMAVSGTDIWFTINSGSVVEYNTSGLFLSTLVSGDGLDLPHGIAVIPEPSSWALAVMGFGLLVGLRVFSRRSPQASRAILRRS